MQGFQLTFFTQQDRMHGAQPLAQWLLATASGEPRFADAPYDLLTLPEADAEAMAGLDVGSIVTIPDLPAQLPVIEGTTLSATDSHTLDLDMPRAMDLNRVFAALNDAGIRVRSMRTKCNRLEELFVRLTAKEAA